MVLPNFARMSVETSDGSTLSVQVKVHDGITDVRASGPAAPLIEGRQGELRVALAREGLALGHFDLTQSDSRHSSHRFETPEDRELPTRRPQLRASTPTHRADGRLSVKA